MADKRISELPGAASLNGADLVPIVQAGDTKKLSAAALKAYTNSDVVLASEKGAVSGVATLDSAGKLSSAQIPDISVVDYLGSAANQTAMLALTGQKGDWCTRVDLGTTWVISGSNPTQLGSWTELSYPVAPVTSVAGKTGVVTLSKSDVGLGNVNNTADADKPISTATQTALDLKVAKDSSTGSAYLPTGTTAQRTATPTAGLVRYNSTTQKFEGYGSAWGNLGGGAYIGDTAPSNPGNGDLWWSSLTGHTYVYYGTAWVDLFGGAEGQYLPLTGGTVSGNLAYTGTLTGGTGIINIGSGQIYKDAAGSVGFKVIPPVNNTISSIFIPGNSAFTIAGRYGRINQNAYWNNGWKYITANTAQNIEFIDGAFVFSQSTNTPTVDGSITYSQNMTLAASGNLIIGNTVNNAGSRLFVDNSITTDFSGVIAMRYNVSGQTNSYYKGMAGVSPKDGSARGLHLFNYDQDSNQGILFWPASYPGVGTGNPAMTLFPNGGLVLGDTGTYSANTKIYVNGTSDNNLPLNVITDSGTNAGAAALRINSSSNLSTAYFLLTRNSAASFYGLATNGASTFSSDETLKKNFELARDGYLADICKIPVKKYHWKTQDDSEAKEIGWTAQDVQKVFPGMVQESPEGTLMLKGSVMVPILFKALQELTTRLETLEARTA